MSAIFVIPFPKIICFILAILAGVSSVIPAGIVDSLAGSIGSILRIPLYKEYLMLFAVSVVSSKFLSSVKSIYL